MPITTQPKPSTTKKTQQSEIQFLQQLPHPPPNTPQHSPQRRNPRTNRPENPKPINVIIPLAPGRQRPKLNHERDLPGEREPPLHVPEQLVKHDRPADGDGDAHAPGSQDRVEQDRWDLALRESLGEGVAVGVGVGVAVWVEGAGEHAADEGGGEEGVGEAAD